MGLFSSANLLPDDMVLCGMRRGIGVRRVGCLAAAAPKVAAAFRRSLGRACSHRARDPRYGASKHGWRRAGSRGDREKVRGIADSERGFAARAARARGSYAGGPPVNLRPTFL